MSTPPPYTQHKPNTGDSSALTHYPNNTPSHYIMPFPMLIIALGLPYDTSTTGSEKQ